MSLSQDREKVAELVRNALQESMTALGPSHDCEVVFHGPRLPSDAPDKQWVLTEVALFAKGIEARLLLAATQSDAFGLWPLDIAQASPTDEDMIGEFANCIAGSVQTRLACNAIELSMGTPQTLRGSYRQVVATRPQDGWEHYGVRTAKVFAVLSVQIDKDFRWSPLSADDESPLSEGFCLVF